jgi:hypothetical protein
MKVGRSIRKEEPWMPPIKGKELKDLKAKLQDIKNTIPSTPVIGTTETERLTKYNKILADVGSRSSLRAIPSSPVSLTPANPRTPDQQCYLQFYGKGLFNFENPASSYISLNDVEPAYSFILLHFSTIKNVAYALDVQIWNKHDRNWVFLTGIDGAQTQFSTLSGGQTIIYGFKAVGEISEIVLVALPPPAGDDTDCPSSFAGCKLTPLI